MRTMKTNKEGKKVLDEYQIKTAGNLVHEQLPPPDIHFEIEKLNPPDTGFYSELGSSCLVCVSLSHLSIKL